MTGQTRRLQRRQRSGAPSQQTKVHGRSPSVHGERKGQGQGQGAQGKAQRQKIQSPAVTGYGRWEVQNTKADGNLRLMAAGGHRRWACRISPLLRPNVKHTDIHTESCSFSMSSCPLTYIQRLSPTPPWYGPPALPAQTSQGWGPSRSRSW